MAAEKQTCVICQTEIASIDATSLPCAHTFHFSCMFDYIENKVNCQMDIDCPLCRCNHFLVNSNEYAYLRHQVFEKQNNQRKEQEKNYTITPNIHQIRPMYPIQPTQQYKHHKRNSSGCCVSTNNSYSLHRNRKILFAIIISACLGIALGVAFGTHSIKA